MPICFFLLFFFSFYFHFLCLQFFEINFNRLILYTHTLQVNIFPNMVSNQAAAQLPHLESSTYPSSSLSLSNTFKSTLNDLIKTNSSNTLRKLLLASATTLGVAAFSYASYALFNSYVSRKKSSDQAQNLFNDIEFEPNLSKSKRPREEIEEIEKILNEFKLSDETLRQIMEILDNEMEKGLNRSTNSEADLKMLPTYVCQLPTGRETNDILALDLGGSNFRVLLIRLRENEEPKILNKVFIVSESIMKGSGAKVYTFYS